MRETDVAVRDIRRDEATRGMRRLMKTVSQLQILEQGTPIYEFNVSNPPTSAELDAGIGAAANLPPGFEAFVDDAGAGVTVWKVGVVNGLWWYVAYTLAV